jgi:hypothetical protein
MPSIYDMILGFNLARVATFWISYLLAQLAREMKPGLMKRKRTGLGRREAGPQFVPSAMRAGLLLEGASGEMPPTPQMSVVSSDCPAAAVALLLQRRIALAGYFDFLLYC